MSFRVYVPSTHRPRFSTALIPSAGTFILLCRAWSCPSNDHWDACNIEVQRCIRNTSGGQFFQWLHPKSLKQTAIFEGPRTYSRARCNAELDFSAPNDCTRVILGAGHEIPYGPAFQHKVNKSTPPMRSPRSKNSGRY